jgi:hypothetical protein
MRKYAQTCNEPDKVSLTSLGSLPKTINSYYGVNARKIGISCMRQAGSTVGNCELIAYFPNIEDPRLSYYLVKTKQHNDNLVDSSIG